MGLSIAMKCVLAIALVLGVVMSAECADIYVATSGDDSTGTGGVGSPFASLAKALTATSGGETTTIHMSAGTYTESGTATVQAGHVVIVAGPGSPGDVVVTLDKFATPMILVDTGGDVTVQAATIAGSGGATATYVSVSSAPRRPQVLLAEHVIAEHLIDETAGFRRCKVPCHQCRVIRLFLFVQ